MSLRQRQSEFLFAIAELILWVRDNPDLDGYELTFGMGYSPPRCKCRGRGSFHKKRLAMDLNLFIYGVWQTTTEAHTPIGEKWESMGGTWGGRFLRRDGNHYSLGE
jgi:hypothetical protein